MMPKHTYVEGDFCPACNQGTLEYPEVENCSCHITPPCSQCVNNLLECTFCHIDEEDIESEEL